MYNPCKECWDRYGRVYSENCDNFCEYAHELSKLKPYGGIDAVLKVMKGDAFPVVFIDNDHIDRIYRIVCAARDGII